MTIYIQPEDQDIFIEVIHLIVSIITILRWVNYEMEIVAIYLFYFSIVYNFYVL